MLDEFPDDAGAMNDLGYLWADQDKNLQRARRMIRKAVDAEPDNAAYRDSLGWVLFRLGRYPAGRWPNCKEPPPTRAPRHGPRPPRRRVSEDARSRQGRRELAQGGRRVSAREGD